MRNKIKLGSILVLGVIVAVIAPQAYDAYRAQKYKQANWDEQVGISQRQLINSEKEISDEQLCRFVTPRYFSGNMFLVDDGSADIFFNRVDNIFISRGGWRYSFPLSKPFDNDPITDPATVNRLASCVIRQNLSRFKEDQVTKIPLHLEMPSEKSTLEKAGNLSITISLEGAYKNEANKTPDNIMTVQVLYNRADKSISDNLKQACVAAFNYSTDADQLYKGLTIALQSCLDRWYTIEFPQGGF